MFHPCLGEGMVPNSLCVTTALMPEPFSLQG